MNQRILCSSGYFGTRENNERLDRIVESESIQSEKPDSNLLQTNEIFLPKCLAMLSGLSPCESRAATRGPLTADVVTKGETLSSIARRYYGDGGKWKELRDFNRQILTQGNLIKVGQIIVGRNPTSSEKISSPNPPSAPLPENR